MVEALAEGRYDLVHLCSPGPAGIAAAVTARIAGAADWPAPTTPSWPPTPACARATRALELGVSGALGAFYGAVRRRALAVGGRPTRGSPRSGSRRTGSAAGTAASTSAASAPSAASPAASAGRRRVHVLYAGRLTKEKGADLLAEAFLAARARDPRLHLLLAGGGPEEDTLRERLGDRATFLGWLDGDALARAYASRRPVPVLLADRHVRPGDPRGAGVRAAGRRGRAPAARRADRADGRSGLLCPPDAARAGGGGGRAWRASRAARERLARGGLAAVRERTWETALGRLGAGWQRALDGRSARVARAA